MNSVGVLSVPTISPLSRLRLASSASAVSGAAHDSIASLTVAGLTGSRENTAACAAAGR